MNIRKEKNTIMMQGREISFPHKVETILEFPKYCVVLLIDDYFPTNNVEAIDYEGNQVWNISQIIKFTYPEAYVSLGKETETSFSVITYNGVEFVVDVRTNQIVSKRITK